jgi:transcription-repair coupling factor (superfamily II helicase)
MIPTRYDYYRRRLQEHRRLAQAASEPEQRAMHDRLVEVYGTLARQSRLRQVVKLKVPANA